MIQLSIDSSPFNFISISNFKTWVDANITLFCSSFLETVLKQIGFKYLANYVYISITNS